MKEEKKETNTRNSDASKPDKETLHTTDPQKHMEGPVSSSMKGLGDAFDTDEDKEEADDKRERNF